MSLALIVMVGGTFVGPTGAGAGSGGSATADFAVKCLNGDAQLVGTITVADAPVDVSGSFVIQLEEFSDGHILEFRSLAVGPHLISFGFVGQSPMSLYLSYSDGDGSHTIFSAAFAGFTCPSLPSEPVSVVGRLFDSRPGHATSDGQFSGSGRRPPGSVLELPVAGRLGVASDARAVVLTVTAVDASAPGYITVYPCGQPAPTTSNVNYLPGQTISNVVVSRVGVEGRVCVYTNRALGLVIDVSGVFTTETIYTPLVTPVRMMDTRPGHVAVDSLYANLGTHPGGWQGVRVAGRGGVPLGAASVVVNLTVVDARADGFAIAFPCGTVLPTASTLNFTTGQTVSNAVVTAIGQYGQICIYTNAATDLVVDVSGYFPWSAGFQPLPIPARLADSRAGASTTDGQFAGDGPLSAGTVTELAVGGRFGIKSVVRAVALNVTVTDPATDGYLTVYPCGTSRPPTSNVNFSAHQTIAGAVVVEAGAGGRVCVYTNTTTDFVVDITGIFS